ncbi:RNase A-like domain-containing protein [Catenuloplanes indicus]|uniref:RNase A-like domain-containing protein n=1 Tax=Catenuloplanes indicus TaxID=137267 RepID=UPI0027D8A398|nr:RNase A-like domain-containing protein [Catenuloplanes indicus]
MCGAAIVACVSGAAAIVVEAAEFAATGSAISTGLITAEVGIAEGAGLTAAGAAAKLFCSFSGDTRVLMADGTSKEIADIEVGDEVAASDPETGESGARKVAHLWPHRDDLVLVRIDGEVLTATEDHPVWNASDRQWQRMDELDAGDALLTPSGRPAILEDIEYGFSFGAAAYDLTVDSLHTYYVLAGNTPVLVHNCGNLVGDAARFPNAHVLNEHVNVSDVQLVQMAQATGVKSRFLDLQTAQQVVDYGLAGNKDKIDRWLRGGGVGNLEINGRFGANNPIGVVARADGSISPSSNAYTIVLQRAQGHPGGYYVYTAYPR